MVARAAPRWPTSEPAVERLRDALEAGEGVFTTGLVLQELQGFGGPKARDAIVERFGALPLGHQVVSSSSRPLMGMPTQVGREPIS